MDASPSNIGNSKVLSGRSREVQILRASSSRAATRKLASSPAEFGENRQRTERYIAIPRMMSETRKYVSLAILESITVINDKCSSISGAAPSLFEILSSGTFNVWNRAIFGRTRKDTLRSNTITYNHVPFPELTDEARGKLDESGHAILSARVQFPGETLATRYHPPSMSGVPRKAHEAKDKAVNEAYRLTLSSTGSDILNKLFERYSAPTSRIGM